MALQGKNYSKEELSNMQRDAMDRVREMQRRADESLRKSNNSFAENLSSQQSVPQNQADVEKQSVNLNQNQSQFKNDFPQPQQKNVGKLSNIFSAIGIDQDQVIILALLFILYNDEQTDPLILLALVYLLL